MKVAEEQNQKTSNENKEINILLNFEKRNGELLQLSKEEVNSLREELNALKEESR